MASATDTANPDQAVTRRDHRRGGWPLGSRLGRLIIILNLLGLAILVAGALILNELRQGLVEARRDSLAVQGQLIANVIDKQATAGEPEPALDGRAASAVMRSLEIPDSQRARLYDIEGRLLADSDRVSDRVGQRPLAPSGRPGRVPIDRWLAALWPPPSREAARLGLAREVAHAVAGEAFAGLRLNEDGRRVVSVSTPIRHVRRVLGVLTLEAQDVDSIIVNERRALIPFILIAIGVALLSSLLLTQLIAVPVLRLARAADSVRLSRARSIALPDLAGRDDELGDLTRSLEAMTQTLSDRLVAIERFAADVSHELRNPMTSIRSAVDTLGLVKTDAQRQRLMSILRNDVERLDRLITDISNASRLDAELSRKTPTPMDLGRLLSDICAFYQATGKPRDARVTFIGPTPAEPLMVLGREGPLGQVFRNLIDNARSFSPPGGEVRVRVTRTKPEILVQVDDDGPGVPPDNLETIFQRFYTSRPKGAAFGGNSGLGLAIARQIIETHGGRIWAENRPGASHAAEAEAEAEAEGPAPVAGASFRVALPAA